MNYLKLKHKLMGLFEKQKLDFAPSEYGFFNEKDKEIKTVGYAVSLTVDTVKEAIKERVDLLLTHHDACASFVCVYHKKYNKQASQICNNF